MRASVNSAPLMMHLSLSTAPVKGTEPGGSQAPQIKHAPGARQDMAELEAAVGQSLAPVEALGGPHRVLRAFRPLLFLDTGALAGSPLLGALPPGVALSHLFSRAPPGLQSPHQRSGFTPAQVPPAHRGRLCPGIRV